MNNLKGELMAKTQRLTSVEADFDSHTWTFHAPNFVCGAGDYLVISWADWHQFWREHDPELAGSPET